MTSRTTLNDKTMRRLVLHAQGLTLAAPFGRGQKAIPRAIQNLYYLQIDTISVVNRAHHHVLASRIPNYQHDMLDKAQRGKKVYEYWAHAAAYLPIEHYRFSLPLMKGYANKRELDKKWQSIIRKRIQTEGPLQSRDFENPSNRKSGGWWDWKPAKMALEHMFLGGELMVTERRGFQKVFDLTENHLPDHVDTSHPNEEELGRFHIRSMLNALGAGTLKDIAYGRLPFHRWAGMNLTEVIQSALAPMIEDGEVIAIDWHGETYFALRSALEGLPARMGKKRIHILSPFDNLVINRDRLSRLFDFDFQLECYVPQPKRQFGYFTLPILWGDSFVGRLDAKAERKQSILKIHNIWLEPGVIVSDELLNALAEGLVEFSRTLDAQNTKLTQTFPATLKQPLEARLN